ncbi:hypothetical protein AYI69_g11499 [Smittium culicis]|uniref:Uncharacterized protein n=1 Tax=Smittium culicis TaxID=133412 RepID=A0A1R1WY73_9FUNG|nr:hypothetical protein AYI69_g11499 [Smittium culicis]
MWSTVSGTHKLHQEQKILNFWDSIFIFGIRKLQVRIHSLKINPVAFFPNFSVYRPPVDDRPSAKFFDPPVTPVHPCGHPGLHRCLDEEAVGSVHSLPDLVLVVLDRPRYVPLAIHNIAQVGVLVGGVDFLALQGHISGQLPAYSHYPALGGIHSQFPSVRPFGYGIQCSLYIS